MIFHFYFCLFGVYFRFTWLRPKRNVKCTNPKSDQSYNFNFSLIPIFFLLFVSFLWRGEIHHQAYLHWGKGKLKCLYKNLNVARTHFKTIKILVNLKFFQQKLLRLNRLWNILISKFNK